MRGRRRPERGSEERIAEDLVAVPRTRRDGLAGVVVVAAALLVPACSPAEPDAAARADADDASQARLDELRALPYSAFSTQAQAGRTGVVLLDEEASQPGLSLYTTFGSSRADLIDEHGVVVRSWTHSPSASWGSAELMANGDLVVTGIADVREAGGRYLLRLDWDGDVVWKRLVKVHHDVEEQPDGGLLALTYAKRSHAWVSETVPTRVDFLQWFDAAGNAGARISLLDVLVKEGADYAFLSVGTKRKLPREGTWVDLTHANTARTLRDPALAARHPLYRPGNVIVTLRHQDVVVIVDPTREEAVWHWGQGVLSGPHHAQVLASGNLLIFDNGLGPHRQWSRVIELDPLTKEIVWEYSAPNRRDFFTLGRGSCQRLANGNTLIAESNAGRAFEVTAGGRIVWEFINPLRDAKQRPATIVRIRRYPREWFGEERLSHPR